MDPAVCLVIFGLCFSTSAANTDQGEKQWLTKEDLYDVVSALRTEHAEELANVKAAFKAELATMTKSFNQKLEEIQGNLNQQQQINHVTNHEVERLRDVVQQLERKVTQLTADGDNVVENKTANRNDKSVREQIRTKSIRNRIGTAKSKRLVLDTATEVSPAAFTVLLSQSSLGEHLGAHQTIPFDVVVSNLGNAFDKRVGIFTAPAPGWYVFSLTLMSRPNETQQLEVVVDNAHLFFCYSTGNEFNSVSKTVVTHLARGNEVWVRMTGSTGSGFSANVHAFEHTSFTGYMLYAD